MSHATTRLPAYKLKAVLAYLQAHLDDKVTVATLAAVGGRLSVPHFSRLFKATTGLSPYQYLLRARIERAQQLLAETDLPIAHIAVEVGFADQPHFTQHFRVELAVTPRAYRISQWNERSPAA